MECPKEMERRGTASTFKESVTLLHKYYSVFLLFVLAYYLTISIVMVYETLILPPFSTPLLDARVDKDSINTAQTTDPLDVLSFMHPWTLSFFFSVMGLLTEIEAETNAARSATAASQITPTPKDSGFFFNASLRTFIIEFYIFLAFLLHTLLFVIIGGLLQAIIFATAGLADPELFFSNVLLYVLGYFIGLAILVALVQVVLVLVHWRRETIRKRSADSKQD